MKIRVRDRIGNVHGYTVANAESGAQDYGMLEWLKLVMFETAGKHPDYRVVMMEVPRGPRPISTGLTLNPGVA